MRRQGTDTGRIVVESLHAGPYEIEIRDADGSVVEIAEVDLSSGGEHTLTIDIRTIAATGTLRCGDEPLEREITFTNLTGRSVRATTDAAGRFEVSFPGPGVWDAELRYPLDARASMVPLEPVEIPAGTKTTLDLRVPGGRITGRVTASTGAGEQAAVHVRSGGKIVAQLITGLDGTFDIVGIQAGAYVVDGEGRGGTTPQAVAVTIEKQETQTVTLRLEPYRWIRGVIRTPHGAPASGALVRISTDHGARWVRAVTDAGGKFEHQLPGGTDEVQLIILTYSYPALAMRTMPAPDPVDITLPAAGGILRVAGGQNPAIQSMGFRVPIRFLYFPEPFGQHDGGVHLPAGAYVVCPSMNPAAHCQGATIASSSETQITFTAEPPKARYVEEPLARCGAAPAEFDAEIRDRLARLPALHEETPRRRASPHDRRSIRKAGHARRDPGGAPRGSKRTLGAQLPRGTGATRRCTPCTAKAEVNAPGGWT